MNKENNQLLKQEKINMLLRYNVMALILRKYTMLKFKPVKSKECPYYDCCSFNRICEKIGIKLIPELCYIIANAKIRRKNKILRALKILKIKLKMKLGLYKSFFDFVKDDVEK
jgi:hypothetical protein